MIFPNINEGERPCYFAYNGSSVLYPAGFIENLTGNLGVVRRIPDNRILIVPFRDIIFYDQDEYTTAMWNLVANISEDI